MAMSQICENSRPAVKKKGVDQPHARMLTGFLTPCKCRHVRLMRTVQTLTSTPTLDDCTVKVSPDWEHFSSAMKGTNDSSDTKNQNLHWDWEAGSIFFVFCLGFYLITSSQKCCRHQFLLPCDWAVWLPVKRLLCTWSKIQTAQGTRDWNKDTKALVFNGFIYLHTCEMFQKMNINWPDHRVNSPVIPNVESVEALCEALHVVGADFLQKVNVVFWVETAHVMLRCFVWFKHLREKKNEGISRENLDHC